MARLHRSRWMPGPPRASSASRRSASSIPYHRTRARLRAGKAPMPPAVTENPSRPARSRTRWSAMPGTASRRRRAQERQRDMPALRIGPAPIGIERSSSRSSATDVRSASRRSSGSGTATKQRQGRGAAAGRSRAGPLQARIHQWHQLGQRANQRDAALAGRASVNRSRRSMSTGAMPTAMAPCTSASRWSPTWIASSGRTPASARACSKMPRCGFS